jgi:hypothetical protein
MAQIDYFMTDAETSRLVEELVLRFGARFTPQEYGSSSFPSLTSLEDVIAYEHEGHFRTRFFVTSAQWGLHPFKIEEFHDPKYHHFGFNLGMADRSLIIVPQVITPTPKLSGSCQECSPASPAMMAMAGISCVRLKWRKRSARSGA